MIPSITAKQARMLDHLMEHRFHIPAQVMMDQAGYRLAEFIRTIDRKSKPVIICAGKGNNGGDGIASARHLKNFGYTPKIFLASIPVTGNPSAFLDIATEMGIPIIGTIEEFGDELLDCGTIIDCLIGYNLKGSPKPHYAEIIEMMNASKKPIVSCDLPSGVDPDGGQIHDVFAKATHILALSLPKAGCRGFDAEQYVADIGVPEMLYPLIGLPAMNHFEKTSIIRI